MNKIRTVGISIGVGLFMVLAWLGFVGPAAAESSGQTVNQATAAANAVQWLMVTHQNDDGGFTSFSAGANQAESDVGGTLDALLAIAAASENGAAPFPGRELSVVDYLQANATAAAEIAAQDGAVAGKMVLALTASHLNPRDFAGTNFVTILQEQLQADGSYNVPTAFNQSLAILALAGVGEEVPSQALTWLLDLQAVEGDLAGSWDDGFGTPGNPDSTAMAILALTATGVPAEDPAVAAALGFLAQSQLATGGWEYAAGFGENANSTALVIQALAALEEDFFSENSSWSAEGISPLAALLAWQSPAGAFQADFGSGRFDDFFATVQSVAAAAGRYLPLSSRYQAVQNALGCLETLQDPGGGWEEFAGAGVNAGGTARAIMAIEAAGQSALDARWQPGDQNPLDALALLTPDYLAGGRGGRVGIVLQGMAALEADPADFADYNLALSLTNYLSPTGEYASTAFGPFAHGEAMLGLLAHDLEVDPLAVEWLMGARADGSWGDPDSNGMALQVLGGLGMAPPEAVFLALKAAQWPDGGWGFDGASPNSTAEVAQGLVAVGQNPFGPAWSVVVSGTLQGPAEAIMAGQTENGCWPNLFGPGDDIFATTDAIMLLSLQPPWSPPEPVLLDGAVEDDETLEDQVDVDEAVAEPTVEAEPEPTAVPLPTAEEVTVEEDDSAAEQASTTDEPDPVTGADEGDAEDGADTAAGESESAAETAEDDTESSPFWLFALLAAVFAAVGAWFWRRQQN